MKLTWYGTAALLLEDGETKLAFDPFLGIPEGGLAPAKKTSLAARNPYMFPEYAKYLRQAREIFITHGHLDHILHLPLLYNGRRVQIHCTGAPRKTLLRHGMKKELLQQISPGFTGIYGPFTVRAFQGRHCRFDLPLLRRTVFCRRFFRYPLHLFRLLGANVLYPEKGEILFYEVSCRNLRIQIMGSMNLDPRVSYPTGADILILPLQGRSDQDTYALQFIRRLKPRAVLLDHYDNTFPPLTGEVDVSGFVRNVKTACFIPCAPLVRGETMMINTGKRKKE